MSDRVHDYHDGNRYYQDLFDTRRLADYITKTRVQNRIDEVAKKVIQDADMFFLATCDHRGLPTCSYKGGDPGFIQVLDEKTLAFPNYDGNGKYQSIGNLLKNPNVGLLFIDFADPSRIRLQGTATAHENDELQSQYPGAQFMVRVHVSEVYVLSSICPQVPTCRTICFRSQGRCGNSSSCLEIGARTQTIIASK